MGSDRRAILFCPPLAPVELESDSRVAIGRGRDCELPLFSDSASRRHAEVYPHTLRPGDRIGIGANVITFCRVESSLSGFLSDPAGHETMVFARAVAREVFRGELAEMPIFVVLQMLEMGHKSGELEVTTDAGVVHLWLGDGQPLHAASEKAQGMDAAMAIVGTTRGSFRFVANVETPARTLQVSMTELLLEASRQLDEARR